MNQLVNDKGGYRAARAVKNAKKSDAIQTRNGWVKKGGKEAEI